MELKDAYQVAIDLYNETIGQRSWCRDDFVAELEKQGLSNDDAFLAYIKVAYDLKFNIKKS